MNLKTTLFSIFNKEIREMEYIKDVYKIRVQAEIESFKDLDEEENRDTIKSQDVLILDKISI